MEKNVVLFSFFVLLILLLVLAPVKMFGSKQNRCSCYFANETKNACYEGEYRGEKLIKGECKGGCCYTLIKVKCYDKDEKEPYSENVRQERCDCNECVNGGTGDDLFNSMFWWLPLLY